MLVGLFLQPALPEVDVAFAFHIQRQDVQGRDMCQQYWQTKVC